MARMTTAVRAAATLAGAALLVAGVTAPANATPAIVCTYTVSSWAGGFSADISMANSGPAIEGWTVRFSFDTPTQLLGGWHATLTQQGQTMTGVNLAWNSRIGTGQAVAFGWTAFARSAEIPDDITVNGVSC
ncbi:cellulose binding domain-containing protein [Streptosporangiaceae bacterium NEAU-GS5]|nr:cellulose binding domain-containing protein [Streptosporangiaceae bacterium NEAU-GS5]